MSAKTGILKINSYYEYGMTKFVDKLSNPIITIAAVLIYKILLDIMYCQYIGGVHTFFSVYVSPLNVINGWFMVLLMSVFFEKHYLHNAPSSIILLLFNIVYFIPITTYCGYGGGSSSFLMWAFIYWIILSVLQIKIPIVIIKEKPKRKFSGIAFYIMMFCVSLLTLFIWAKFSNFRIWFHLLDVYDIRRSAAENGLPIVLSYLRSISNIIISMLLVMSLHKKKYLSFMWLLFMVVLSFSYAGDKIIIFLPFILVGGYIFYRKNFIRLIMPGFILLQILAFIEQHFGSGELINLIFRRQGVLLGLLSENYYRFFLENSNDIFRQGILGKLGFNSIYNPSLANVIGNNFETQIVNCNNGLLADVWASVGIVGIIVLPIILIICFRLLDMSSYGIDYKLTFGLIGYCTINFVNASWSTVLLTHGFLLMCIVFLIFPRESSNLIKLEND